MNDKLRRIGLCAAMLIIPVVILIFGSGCKIPSGSIVSMTVSSVGIRVGQNPQTQTPELEVGFHRATYQFVPTSTNQIYAPKVNSSLSMDQKNFSTSIDEDFQTGGADHPTTNSVAQRGAAMRLKSPKVGAP